MKNKIIALASLLVFPTLAFAQLTTSCTNGSGTTPTDIGGFICTIGNILKLIIPTLIILGLLYFVYGVVTYVIASDEEAKKKGRDRMIYGIIGFAVIVGLWGLVYILGKTFGVNSGGANNGNAVTFPTVNYGS